MGRLKWGVIFQVRYSFPFLEKLMLLSDVIMVETNKEISVI